MSTTAQNGKGSDRRAEDIVGSFAENHGDIRWKSECLFHAKNSSCNRQGFEHIVPCREVCEHYWKQQ